MVATKVRLRFAKRGDLRFASHHDLMRCLERALRRAAMPVAYTQGFTPRPKVYFAQALALGIEGRREVVEIELAEPLSAEAVIQRLGAVLPAGFDLVEAELLAPGRPARPVSVCYHLAIPPERRGQAETALATLLAERHHLVRRNRHARDVPFDLRASVIGAELDCAGCLRFQLKIDPVGTARADELLEALGLRDLLDSGSVLVRDDIELAPAPTWGAGPPSGLHDPGDAHPPKADFASAGRRPPEPASHPN
jgi:radical SAM-linked protein